MPTKASWRSLRLCRSGEPQPAALIFRNEVSDLGIVVFVLHKEEREGSLFDQRLRRRFTKREDYGISDATCAKRPECVPVLTQAYPSLTQQTKPQLNPGLAVRAQG